MTTKKQREATAEGNFYQRKQKKPLKWDNLLTKCKKCGSTKLQKMNLYKGMNKKNSDGNYQLIRCSDCGHEEFYPI